MRLSSGERNPHGFRAISNGEAGGEERGKPGMGMGMGSSRSSRYREWKPVTTESLPWSERRKDLFDWADSHLPDQHPAFVVVAIIAIRMGGEKPTKEKVLERLRATGREASQIGYGPGGEAA